MINHYTMETRVFSFFFAYIFDILFITFYCDHDVKMIDDQREGLLDLGGIS